MHTEKVKSNNLYKLEICANSVESCVEAQKGGAYRVELCAGIPEGGTTPSYGTIALARKEINIRLNVIIRPRGGDFLYSKLEQETMIEDIRMAKQLGVDGVVFGCLTQNGHIDIKLCEQLLAQADGLSTTFHRAFDVCNNPQKALEQLIEMGFNHVLTSGQQASAEQGIPLLKELVAQANNRIIIMPGCGVRSGNIKKIAQETGALEFHTSARDVIAGKMIYRNPSISMGGNVCINEYEQEQTSNKKVNEIISILNNL